MLCPMMGNGIPITCTAIYRKRTGQPMLSAGSKNPTALAVWSVKLHRKEFVMHTSQETIWQSTDLRNDMKAHIELLEILAEAEADVQNSRTAPAADTFNALRASLQKGSLKV